MIDTLGEWWRLNFIKTVLWLNNTVSSLYVPLLALLTSLLSASASPWTFLAKIRPDALEIHNENYLIFVCFLANTLSKHFSKALMPDRFSNDMYKSPFFYIEVPSPASGTTVLFCTCPHLTYCAICLFIMLSLLSRSELHYSSDFCLFDNSLLMVVIHSWQLCVLCENVSWKPISCH